MNDCPGKKKKNSSNRIIQARNYSYRISSLIIFIIQTDTISMIKSKISQQKKKKKIAFEDEREKRLAIIDAI